jgi:ribonuclease P protein component
VKGTLRNRRHFQRVYASGRKAVGLYCVVYAYSPQPQEIVAVGERAVGVVASKKVGGAVQRARAKRVLRAAYQPLRARVRPPAWIVLVARRELVASSATSVRVGNEMQKLMQRLSLLAPAASSARGDELAC